MTNTIILPALTVTAVMLKQQTRTKLTSTWSPNRPTLTLWQRAAANATLEQVQNSRESLHFTLRNEANLVRKHFGSTENLERLTQLEQPSSPATSQELVDDMLLRRCLRCHVYTSGDTYPLTRRGTGCAACHLHFIDGKLDNHKFIGPPGDDQCLSCHYANFVGADYYGRYENDFNWEYRTPYVTREEYVRAYGVEYHDLAPDIHQQRGLSCVDCHSGHMLMGDEQRTIMSCSSCHDWDEKMLKSFQTTSP